MRRTICRGANLARDLWGASVSHSARPSSAAYATCHTFVIRIAIRAFTAPGRLLAWFRGSTVRGVAQAWARADQPAFGSTPSGQRELGCHPIPVWENSRSGRLI